MLRAKLSAKRWQRVLGCVSVSVEDTQCSLFLFRQAFRPMSASQLATRVVKATSTPSANPALNKLFEPPTSNPLNLPLFEPVSTQVFVVVHPNVDIETESHKKDGWICGSIRSSRE